MARARSSSCPSRRSPKQFPEEDTTKTKVTLVLTVGLAALALVAGASGLPSQTTSIDPRGEVVALAVHGSRVAYALEGKVFLWNIRTGTTTKVSGARTSELGQVTELGITGSQVAWYVNLTSNSESDDYLFESSVLKPKERHVASEVRMGDPCGAAGGPGACVGDWIGGVVVSSNRILVNRWSTNASGSIASAGLYVLSGTRLAPIAAGAGTVAAVAADSKRVAALRTNGSIGVYSAAGKHLATVIPSARTEQVALSGRNLLVLEPNSQLALYDADTGSLRKTFILHGHPDQLERQALAVHNGIAVYSTPTRGKAGGVVTATAIRAIKLSSGRDRLVGSRPGQITIARLSSFGLVYAGNGNTFGPNRLVFVPLAKVAAAVS